MLRLQPRLPDEYTAAEPEELEERIRAARATLGDQLLILGHHYQRDEVIRWADARGDSFNLARFAADNERATDIVFCGVHFMAESADVYSSGSRGWSRSMGSDLPLGDDSRNGRRGQPGRHPRGCRSLPLGTGSRACGRNTRPASTDRNPSDRWSVPAALSGAGRMGA